MYEFTSGAKSSERAPRYDLLEPEFLRLTAERMAVGAASHGARNYLKGEGDPEFIQDRINHLVAHVLKFAAGQTDDDHFGAACANLNMLAELLRRTPRAPTTSSSVSVERVTGTQSYTVRDVLDDLP